MKQIAIVHIITKLELGGAQKVCLSLAAGAQKAGLATYIITGSEGILVPLAQQQSYTTIFLDTFHRELTPRFLLDDVRTIFRIWKFLRTIRKNHPTIIVQTHSSKAGIVGRIAATLAGVPSRIHTVHGFALHRHQSWKNWLLYYIPEFICSFLTHHFVYVSQADQALAAKIFPARTQQHQSLIRAAVPVEHFIAARRIQLTTIPARESNITPLVIGSISCFKPPKNLPDLIRAFALVHQHLPHARLEIIGDGELREEIEQCIAQHNLKEFITLLGWQQDVAPHLARWDLYAMTSLWEGLPCAVVEARAAQLPVVSYRTGGIPDIIRHGYNGYLVAQHDWQALARYLISLGEDPVLQERLGTAYDHLEEFSEQYMIKQYLILYQDLI